MAAAAVAQHNKYMNERVCECGGEEETRCESVSVLALQRRLTNNLLTFVIQSAY